jgi:hypothetical protein
MAIICAPVLGGRHASFFFRFGPEFQDLGRTAGHAKPAADASVVGHLNHTRFVCDNTLSFISITISRAPYLTTESPKERNRH